MPHDYLRTRRLWSRHDASQIPHLIARCKVRKTLVPNIWDIGPRAISRPTRHLTNAYELLPEKE
jgi:hypothetical protein